MVLRFPIPVTLAR